MHNWMIKKYLIHRTQKKYQRSKTSCSKSNNNGKRKRDRKVKGGACVDGRKQYKYIAMEGVASPTVQLESLILSLLVDAHKRIYVATVDVVGAYLLVDMENFVLVKLSNEVVNIMCNVNNIYIYISFVVIEHDKQMLYLRLTKALYGCMQSAML